MKKVFQFILICLLCYIPLVSATDLETETANLVAEINETVADLKDSLTEFNGYLNSNKSNVISSLDVDTLQEISTYLHASDYDNAFGVLEAAVNDATLTNMHLATKVNTYYTLKNKIITFVNTNKAVMDFDNGTPEGIGCALDLFNQMKNSFNSIKPTISTTIETLGSVITGVIKNEINANKNIKNSEVNGLINKYKDFGSLLSAVITKYKNSFDLYSSIFEVIGNSDTLFEVTFRKKFRDDLDNLITSAETELKTTIDEFIAKRWEELENTVAELEASDKTVVEKNQYIYDKIDQITDVNDKFVAAINEIIGDLDIASIKAKINQILERGNSEFADAKQYLRDHLVIGDYDIELTENHDEKASINRVKELIILDKVFSIADFKNQIQLANNVGTLEFDLGNYSYVPNKGIVRVTDDNETQKEYKIIVKGDVSGNGVITVTDVVRAAYYSLESIELDEDEVMAADVNSNNAVTVTDVYLIAMKALEGDE